MTTPVFTPFTGNIGPLTRVTPFTHRDNATFLSILQGIVNYINFTMRPEMDAELQRILDEFKAALLQAEANYNGTAAEWLALFNEMLASLEEQIAILNDSAVAGLIADDESLTGIAFDIAVLRKAVGRNELVVDVKDFGAIGNGVVDDTAACQLAADFAADIGAELLYSDGRFLHNGTVNLKAGVNNSRRGVRVVGAIIAGSNAAVLKAEGTWGESKALLADLVPRGRTLTVDNNVWFTVGETLFITSNDFVPNAPDKLGCLRKVISLTGGTIVNIDVPYYRTMLAASSLKAYKLTMHPGVDIIGPGNIRSKDLENNEHLIEIRLANNPRVILNIGPSGGPGVLFSHCDGFEGGGHVHDLRDDVAGIGHYGYGWNVSGGSRNGFITGTAYKCRHAFTTNTAPTFDDFGGEPENIFTDIVTSRCSNKAIDSHRAGWGLTHIVNDSGSYGALQVRADNVHATVYSLETYDGAVNVSSTVTVPPTLERVEVHGSGGATQVGLLLLGPAIVGDVITRGCSTGIDIQSSGSRFNSIDVYGKGPATGAGIEILGNNNTIGDMIFENCGTAVVEKATSTGNIFHGVRRFTNCGVSISLQAYNHMMSLRVGEYQVNAAAPTTIKGRYPVYDNAGNQYGVIPVYTT